MKFNWDGIYGQDEVKNILGKLIESSKIPHAFLFYGSEGTGKEFTAIRFAQALNKKLMPKDVSSQIQHLTEPHIKYIIPLPRGKNETEDHGPVDRLTKDEIELLHEELKKKSENLYHKIFIPKANNIKISSIRDIRKFLSLSFEEIGYRIILISDAHKMYEEAQNALLKNLEEPPDRVIFILSTPYPDYLRETIRSRCWSIHFKPLSNSDLIDALVRYYDVDKNLAEELAPFADGSITNALELIEYDFDLLKEKTIKILRYSFGKKYHSALDEFSFFLGEGNSSLIKLLIHMMIIWLNDLQKYKYKTGDIFFASHQVTLEKFTQKFPDIELTNIVFRLEKLSSLIKNNVNINLIALNIIHELASLISSPKSIPQRNQILDH